MVTAEDIAINLGRPTPPPDSPESRQWTRWIEVAYLFVKAGLRDRGVDPDTVDTHLLDHVVAEVVSGRAKNPDAATQVDVSVDDSRVSRRYATATDGFVISDALWGLLIPPAAALSGAWSFAPSEA